MLIVSPEGSPTWNTDRQNIAGFYVGESTYEGGKNLYNLSVTQFLPAFDTIIYGKICNFEKFENAKKVWSDLIRAYANGEKVFRVPKEEELNDDDD